MEQQEQWAYRWASLHLHQSFGCYFRIQIITITLRCVHTEYLDFELSKAVISTSITITVLIATKTTILQIECFPLGTCIHCIRLIFYADHMFIVRAASSSKPSLHCLLSSCSCVMQMHIEVSSRSYSLAVSSEMFLVMTPCIQWSKEPVALLMNLIKKFKIVLTTIIVCLIIIIYIRKKR